MLPAPSVAAICCCPVIWLCNLATESLQCEKMIPKAVKVMGNWGQKLYGRVERRYQTYQSLSPFPGDGIIIHRAREQVHAPQCLIRLFNSSGIQRSGTTMELASDECATHDVMCDPGSAESGQETRSRRRLLFVRPVFAGDFLCSIRTGQKRV